VLLGVLLNLCRYYLSFIWQSVPAVVHGYNRLPGVGQGSRRTGHGGGSEPSSTTLCLPSQSFSASAPSVTLQINCISVPPPVILLLKKYSLAKEKLEKRNMGYKISVTYDLIKGHLCACRFLLSTGVVVPISFSHELCWLIMPFSWLKRLRKILLI